MAKIAFSDDDLLFGDTFHNRHLFMVGFAREKKVNRILVDGGSGINILPIRTMKELGISTTDLTDSRLMIQGFNQGGQRSIGTVKIDLTIGELQSSVWLHVIDTKTSYNILLGRPWVHENKVIPSTYHQCLKYYEDGVAKSIIADDNPFTEAEAHFADAKFYLKKYSIKVDAIASGDVGLLNNMAKVAVGKAKVPNKEDSKLGNPNKMPNLIGAFSSKKVTPILRYVPKAKEDKGHSLKLRENALEGLTLPVRRIDTMKSSTKLRGKSVAPESLLHGKFVAPKSPLYEALPMKRTEEGFDPNAYKLLVKAGFDPNEPSKLGKLPSEPAMRQQREGLGYKQPPPIRISIKRVSNNYITVEDESTNSNKRPSVFDRLGSSTKRISVFERLGPLRKKNKVWRNSKSMQASALPKSQNAHKAFRSLIPSRMRRQTNIVVSCGEVLKAKSHVVVYTKQRGEDEESVGSSYHVATQDERQIFSPIKIDGELENVSWCYHISFNDGEPQEDEDPKDAPPELEEGVNVTVDALKEINLGTDEDPKPTYVNASLASDEEKAFVDLLKEYKDVFAWSYKEMPGLDPKVAVHHLTVKSGARPIKQAQRRFRPELVPVIETEVNKLIEAGFIREVKYPTWVSSIVPVRKKNGQIRVCVDFRDLNNACPKDEFPLPIPELMIDATTGYEAMSFMDGSSG
ncbi:hypothetical protein KY290_036427 [Solanum tuberosum]|uniref:Gag-pol polyprotein n=1 Tax=Solanum tuberosum TaxID=4113 RepID=A0ABQ7TSN1_SOLTU|nr:hypothetical protein KY289_035947 [Solanum tuberosum]KAH0639147.1 hypothetical protein KY285_035733 [Solanum tuberosum]KAH0737722.1 hypothetical protein KY290_036427 [Solanum tuberosum]